MRCDDALILADKRRDRNGLRRGEREVEEHSTVRQFAAVIAPPRVLQPRDESLARFRMPALTQLEELVFANRP